MSPEQNNDSQISLSETTSVNQQIYLVLSSIPKGKVVTYGQVAKLTGLPNGARQVARALRLLPRNTSIPWFRVINSQGRSSIPGEGAARQISKLEAEGVTFLNGKVNLKQYQWQP